MKNEVIANERARFDSRRSLYMVGLLLAKQANITLVFLKNYFTLSVVKRLSRPKTAISLQDLHGVSQSLFLFRRLALFEFHGRTTCTAFSGNCLWDEDQFLSTGMTFHVHTSARILVIKFHHNRHFSQFFFYYEVSRSRRLFDGYGTSLSTQRRTLEKF